MKEGIRRLAIAMILLGFTATLWAQEVTVIGSQEEIFAMIEADNWWAQKKRGEALKVPYKMVAAITERWQKNAPKMPVTTKQNIFFSALLPLVVHANIMVMDRRNRIEQADKKLAKGGTLSADEVAQLKELAVLLRIAAKEKAARMTDSAEFRKVLKEALYRLDVIPAGLVLGQAAYESGYGTSHFAVKGNALFGQWAFGGKGMIPSQQRKKLGDHRIASFEWPFDSVRGYYLNLSSHPAYEDFRRIRAGLKASGKPLNSLALAEGLKSYSERGQAYVDTLKSIIRSNNLDIADNAAFRDEPMGFIIGAADQDAAKKLRKDIEAMRRSGELKKIVERMRLE